MTDNEYIEFREIDNPGRKTRIWHVVSRSSGQTLGDVRWYGAWRQYCFYPFSATIWNVGCLATVQEFINEQMAARRKR